MTPEEAIAAADLIDAETAYRTQLAREMGERGYERGLAAGYERAIAEVKAVQRGGVIDAELEFRRWGPGGREHFADARPGDFPGRGCPEADHELEVTL